MSLLLMRLRAVTSPPLKFESEVNSVKLKFKKSQPKTLAVPFGEDYRAMTAYQLAQLLETRGFEEEIIFTTEDVTHLVPWMSAAKTHYILKTSKWGYDSIFIGMRDGGCTKIKNILDIVPLERMDDPLTRMRGFSDFIVEYFRDFNVHRVNVIIN